MSAPTPAPTAIWIAFAMRTDNGSPCATTGAGHLSRLAVWHVTSPRPYPARLEDSWYDATHQVRRVQTTGLIKWHGERIFVCEAVRGELVGLVETERGDWLVRIPTSQSSSWRERKKPRRPVTKCYPCIRSNLLPMFPAAQPFTLHP
jgi:hypothetical protein